MKSLDEYITPQHRREMETRFYLSDPSCHERRVLKYSMQLFDALADLFEMGSKKRALLHYSALLHDIGYEIGLQKHDTHTRRIILEDPFFQFLPPLEKTMLALIAGGHRRKIGREIDLLPQRCQETVKQLASLLRIADAIDYPRDEALMIEKVQLTDGQLVIHIHSAAFGAVSARVAQKSDLFHAAFALSLRLEEVGHT